MDGSIGAVRWLARAALTHLNGSNPGKADLRA
jgi:hypothetical protein